ncbi:uncharacterized protein MELLADRAFT_103648 [Melampsora larici-populina 98AG31]|uniref:Uncharacterized protein n=1 Tax=Melampsora larici-populina (strain 98AG31 / pathotype 3-4-7) TaxID=747676 RepID=F4RC08_MELLP|nr:uncharacterized protein MELLADRAFT_103648 [Melampsora larici-populina 98AG31]EGG10244.1 hypothetical protein MELLADRAFT_103648 [Melampsora larici-populina 98AG31]
MTEPEGNQLLPWPTLEHEKLIIPTSSVDPENDKVLEETLFNQYDLDVSLIVMANMEEQLLLNQKRILQLTKRLRSPLTGIFGNGVDMAVDKNADIGQESDSANKADQQLGEQGGDAPHTEEDQSINNKEELDDFQEISYDNNSEVNSEEDTKQSNHQPSSEESKSQAEVESISSGSPSDSEDEADNKSKNRKVKKKRHNKAEDNIKKLERRLAKAKAEAKTKAKRTSKPKSKSKRQNTKKGKKERSTGSKKSTVIQIEIGVIPIGELVPLQIKLDKGLEAPAKFGLSFGDWSECMRLSEGTLLAITVKPPWPNTSNFISKTSQIFIKRVGKAPMKDIGAHIAKYENQEKEKFLWFNEAKWGNTNPYAKGGRERCINEEEFTNIDPLAQLLDQHEHESHTKAPLIKMNLPNANGGNKEIVHKIVSPQATPMASNKFPGRGGREGWRGGRGGYHNR